MAKSRGELEAEFTKEIIKLEKEYHGRGPLDARTFFIDDMILVRLRGVLTQAEQKLAETHKDPQRNLFLLKKIGNWFLYLPRFTHISIQFPPSDIPYNLYHRETLWPNTEKSGEEMYL